MIYISLDDTHHVSSWSYGKNSPDLIEVSDDLIPQDWQSEAFNYIWNGEKLIFDREGKIGSAQAQQVFGLRQEREQECFSIINRGQLWYKSLSSHQLKELEKWYHDWLNVTITLKKPQKPKWLN